MKAVYSDDLPRHLIISFLQVKGSENSSRSHYFFNLRHQIRLLDINGGSLLPVLNYPFFFGAPNLGAVQGEVKEQ